MTNNGKLHPNPDADYQFAAGDLVAVMGSFEQQAAFQAMAASSQIQASVTENKE